MMVSPIQSAREKKQTFVRTRKNTSRKLHHFFLWRYIHHPMDPMFTLSTLKWDPILSSESRGLGIFVIAGAKPAEALGSA